MGSNGSSLAANYQLPNSCPPSSPGCPSMVTYLGRLPAGALNTGTTTLNLLRPADLYPPDRQSQLDLRFAKIVRVRSMRYDLGVDLYNVFNANTATTFTQNYDSSNGGATWLNPTAIMSPRLLRFNVTMTF